MVSAPNVETAPRFTQMLHQCETLKASICGKALEVTSILMEEFMLRQNLENLYKSILLSDVQFALDNKIELELWNNAFKEHIDNFRAIIKEKKNNNEKNEIQAKLFMFLDASIGFYFQLLQEFCDKYDLDLPYHGKAKQLGIIPKPKKSSGEKNPKLDSCLYVCQDCLVHLGDLARYRNEMQQAHAFYLLAAKILPGNGQPYNQLAILASAKNDLLYAVFYYCKSISVPNPFPVAAANLQKTFAQASAKYSYNVLGKSSGLTADEFIGLFINLSGCTYHMQDFSKLNVLRNKILQDFKKMLSVLKSHQLILLTGICIFNLQKSRTKTNIIEYISEDEDNNVWAFILSFCVNVLKFFLDSTIELLQMKTGSHDDLVCLPGIKMFSDWILCNPVGEGDRFYGNVELLERFATLGNELQKAFKQRDKSLYPLLEDRELHGISSLQKVHRRYDFRIRPLDISDERLSNIRVSRIMKFVDWLTKQKNISTLISKRETDVSCEYVCVVPLKHQNGRSKSPFSEKSMSLFRTDSEECVRNEISVQGPVASYSLFDSMWKSSLQQAPPSESVSLITSTSSLLPLKGVTINEDVCAIQLPDMSEENSPIGTPIGTPIPTNLVSSKQSSPQKNSPTFDEMPPGQQNVVPCVSPDIDVSRFPTSVADSPHSHNHIGSPHHMQHNMVMVEQQNGVQLTKEDHSPPRRSLENQLLHALPYQNPTMNMPPPGNQHRHPEIMLAANLFLPKQVQSMDHIPENLFHAPLLSPPTLESNGSAPNHQFSTHPPNFGVIGQNMRAPPGIERNPLVLAPGFAPIAPGGMGNIQAVNSAPSWNHQKNQPVPNNIVAENRSIWSSNYAIGQGELSPLEQLLQEQRRHQRPK